MSFIAIAPVDDNLQNVIDQMDRATQEWTMRAARGECPWVCSDCCSTYPKGMPNECGHGIQACTEIIKRDKAQAPAPQAEQGGDGQGSAATHG